MRSVYFALKFFYNNVLGKDFKEKIPHTIGDIHKEFLKLIKTLDKRTY